MNKIISTNLDGPISLRLVDSLETRTCGGRCYTWPVVGVCGHSVLSHLMMPFAVQIPPEQLSPSRLKSPGIGSPGEKVTPSYVHPEGPGEGGMLAVVNDRQWMATATAITAKVLIVRNLCKMYAQLMLWVSFIIPGQMIDTCFT